ncbi:MAG: STAS domain-containing protein, partial [Planctomycetota bacterium]
DGQVVIIEVETENLNFSVAGQFRDYVQNALDSTSTRTVVLDFARVGFIDSMGIGAIAALAVRMKKRGAELRIANTSSIVKTAMESVKLHEMAAFYPDLGMALGK